MHVVKSGKKLCDPPREPRRARNLKEYGVMVPVKIPNKKIYRSQTARLNMKGIYLSENKVCYNVSHQR